MLLFLRPAETSFRSFLKTARFQPPPAEPDVHLSTHPALQYPGLCLLSGFDLREFDTLSSHGSACMQVVMTVSTEEQRFSFQGDHPHHPGWFWPSCMVVDVFQGPYVMDFYIFGAATVLTYLR